MPPPYVLLPDSVSVPEPSLAKPPEPLITAEADDDPERLKASVPLVATLVASTPPVPPLPTCSVPPGSTTIVPNVPRERVPPTVTSPPLPTASRPVPLLPTIRFVSVENVPPVTVTVPLPWEKKSPSTADEPLTTPPLTVSVAVPLSPTVSTPLEAHVPAVTTTVPRPPKKVPSTVVSLAVTAPPLRNKVPEPPLPTSMSHVLFQTLLVSVRVPLLVEAKLMSPYALVIVELTTVMEAVPRLPTVRELPASSRDPVSDTVAVDPTASAALNPEQLMVALVAVSRPVPVPPTMKRLAVASVPLTTRAAPAVPGPLPKLALLADTRPPLTSRVAALPEASTSRFPSGCTTAPPVGRASVPPSTVVLPE